jgi:predicted molibdopterin-dependent oxidoreductase YjgC
MYLNGQFVSFTHRQTILEVAQHIGVHIPTLCWHKELSPTGGCGVCVVEDIITGRLMPACATRANEAFRIETESPRVKTQRRAVLELLLSNHPADCEAPCQMACPSGLPVPEMLKSVAVGDWATAKSLAQTYPIGCKDVPCEKACRRKPLGGAVAICAIHRLLHGTSDISSTLSAHARKNVRFRSRMAGLSEETLLSLCQEKGSRTEKETFSQQEAHKEAMRCLQCGCLKLDGCVLRELCATEGAKQSTFPRVHVPIVRERKGDSFAFDSSRCVFCGICVRTAQRMGVSIGPTFRGRGFDARIAPPIGRTWDDIPNDVLHACANACPTGAMTVGV